MKALLLPREVAELLAVKEKTLADWRSKDVGPDYIRIGRSIRYSPDALAAFLAESAHVRSPSAAETAPPEKNAENRRPSVKAGARERLTAKKAVSLPTKKKKGKKWRRRG